MSGCCQLGAQPRQSGLTAREQDVIDGYEAGEDKAALASRLGLHPQYVGQIVRTFAFAHVWNVGDRQERAIREADRQYQAALAATGKRYA
jgi:hypothetical protein